MIVKNSLYASDSTHKQDIEKRADERTDTPRNPDRERNEVLEEVHRAPSPLWNYLWNHLWKRYGIGFHTLTGNFAIYFKRL